MGDSLETYGVGCGNSLTLADSPSLAPGRMSASPAGIPQKRKESRAAAGALEAIVSLQTFEGNWGWTDELYKLLCINKEVVKNFPAGLGSDSSIVATACVLAFLEAKMASEKDEWEMLVEKSTRWLAAQLNMNFHTTVEEVIAAAKKLF
jgi:hypothetical protein